jgi:hypothetical protein
MDILLGCLEFMQTATGLAMIMNILYVMFIPISALTTATIFSVIISLIAYQGLRAINAYADDIIGAHIDIIGLSLMYHLNELETEDGE